MASRELTDDSWDSWTFSPRFNFASFAENPAAAPPPFSVGDFNRDGRVDASDYAIWRSDFGSTADLAADASGNGTVDAADYVIWRKASHSPAIAAAVSPIPEPKAATLALCCLCSLWQFRRKRKERFL
jgi:hypothetical protein